MKLPYAIENAGFKKFVALSVVALLSAVSVMAQTTAFTYQGKLTDSGNPANGSYDLQFKLFDTVTVGTGTQQGTTVTVSNVTVAGGIFTVSLDFGACASCFNGAARFLEIAVKPTSGGVFTTLSPRQPLTSTPYALKSLNATAADGLSVTCVNCVTSSQIQSVNGSAVSGTIPVASVPAGSANYIQNTTTQQTATFNISGNGLIGGNVGIGVSSPNAKLSVSTNTTSAGNNTAFLSAPNIGPNASNIHYGTTGDWYIRSAASAGKVIMQDTGGNVGIGTADPSGFFKLDVVGFGGVRAFDNGTGPAHFVAETSGGAGAWARMYMRTTNQSWLIGTSQAFNGDQLYIANGPRGTEATKMVITTNGNVGIGTTNPLTNLHIVGSGGVESSVQSSNERAILSLNSTLSGQNRVWTIENGIFGTPGLFGIFDRTANRAPLTIDTNGKIQTNGNVTQDVSKYGLPKAMLFVQANGTIVRCYNGVTGATTNGCGFSVVRNSFAFGPTYTVNFGFDATNSFISLTSSGAANISGRVIGITANTVTVQFFMTNQTSDTADSDFHIIVY